MTGNTAGICDRHVAVMEFAAISDAPPDGGCDWMWLKSGGSFGPTASDASPFPALCPTAREAS